MSAREKHNSCKINLRNPIKLLESQTQLWIKLKSFLCLLMRKLLSDFAKGYLLIRTKWNYVYVIKKWSELLLH